MVPVFYEGVNMEDDDEYEGVKLTIELRHEDVATLQRTIRQDEGVEMRVLRIVEAYIAALPSGFVWPDIQPTREDDDEYMRAVMRSLNVMSVASAFGVPDIGIDVLCQLVRA